MMRQTSYSREELFTIFKNGKQGNFCCGKDSPGQGIPIGLIVNEIGVLFLTTDWRDEEHGIVEKFLTNIVSDETQYMGNRTTAFFYLKHPSAILVRKESQPIVDKFENNPINKIAVQDVLSKIETL